MNDNLGRNEVSDHDRSRREAREMAKARAAYTKQAIAPGALVKRWKGRQVRKAEQILSTGKETARKNAPYIGIAAAGALLFAARKPIFAAIENLKNRKGQK